MAMNPSTRDFLIVLMILQGILDIFFTIKLDMIESSLGSALIYIGG